MSKPIPLLALGIALLATPWSLSHARGQTVTAGESRAIPFGIELGRTACSELVDEGFAKDPDGSDDLMSDAPASLYPGALKIVVVCRDGKAAAVELTANKGGMGNDASRNAYQTLAGKYRKVAGAPMPSLGDGYARFEAGDTVILQNAPHLSFEFTVSYFTREFYDAMQARIRARSEDDASRKRAAL